MLFKKIKDLQLEARKIKDTYSTSMLTSILGEISRTVSTKAEVLDKDVHAAVKKIINGLEKGITESIEKTGSDGGVKQFYEDIKYLKQFLPSELDDFTIEKIVNDFKSLNPNAQINEAMKHFKTFVGINLQKARNFFEGK